MKKILRSALNVGFLLTVLCLCGLASLQTGCGTTPTAKTAQAEKIVIQSVNDAAAEWAAYVNAGKATQKQIDTVKTAYDAYYTAQLAAKAALEKAIVAGDPAASKTDVDAANDAVSKAEISLITLVNSFIH